MSQIIIDLELTLGRTIKKSKYREKLKNLQCLKITSLFKSLAIEEFVKEDYILYPVTAYPRWGSSNTSPSCFFQNKVFGWRNIVVSTFLSKTNEIIQVVHLNSSGKTSSEHTKIKIYHHCIFQIKTTLIKTFLKTST